MASHWRLLPTGTSPKAASPSISGARSEQLSASMAHRAAGSRAAPTICFSWRPLSDAPALSAAAPEAGYYLADYLADYPKDYRLPCYASSQFLISVSCVVVGLKPVTRSRRILNFVRSV